MKNINLVSDTINVEDVEELVSWLLPKNKNIPKLTKGEKTVEFENKWSKYIGAEHSIFVNSGSSAILLALSALKERGLKNNKVVVPTLSWLTDVSSVMNLDMEPILCDCNLYDLSVDLEELEKLFSEEKPSVFILVSVLGLVPDMNKIVELCNKYDVLLIEDVCESMGSSYNNKKLGTFGIVSLFSLYYGHHISTIEGGLISTNDEELYYIMNALRSHGWDRDWPIHKKEEFRKKYEISEFNSLYTFYYPGYNFRSTDLQAVLGIKQIEKINNFSIIRNKNYLKYDELLKYNLLNLYKDDRNFVSSFAFPYASYKKENIVSELIKNNIEVRPLIAGSMGLKPFWYKKYGFSHKKNADFIDKYGFHLPNHQNLTEQDILKICSIINKIEEEQ